MSNRNKGANNSASTTRQNAKSAKNAAVSAKQTVNEKTEANEKSIQENRNEAQSESTVSKMKRAMSLTGVVFLLALYLLTFVLAITDNSASMQLFYASVVATIVIPVLIWVYLFVFRLMNKGDKSDTIADKSEKTVVKPDKTTDESDKSADKLDKTTLLFTGWGITAR